MTANSDWIVSEAEFDPERLHHKETVFTLGNGYLSTRGAFEEGYPGAWPVTLVHGVFDQVPIVHTELANCPDWLPLVIWVEDERFRLDQGQILDYRRHLDLRRGVLARNVRWRSRKGHTLDLQFERFASLADPHVVALRCRMAALDFAGTVRVQAGLNGYMDNQGVMHWDWIDQDLGAREPAAGPDGAQERTWLHVRTRQSAMELGVAAQLLLYGAPEARMWSGGSPGYPLIETRFRVEPTQTVTLEKSVTVFSSREEPRPAQAAQELLVGLPGYEEMLAGHETAWRETWRESDIVIEGDPQAQLAMRYNMFQILIAAPRNDDRVSIPAKTLSGFGYRGHVFWDTELFIVPFLTFTRPHLARNLLTYRYHTLQGARRKAQAAGHAGAMFAWESADSGDEVTPRWVPVPWSDELVRIWCGDIELHVSSDVAYAAWQYWQASGDDEWMARHGAEIFLDTAVFWGCRAEWNEEQGCYEIRDVIGPDEYHEHVHNNAFTNRMVQWHLRAAPQVLSWLKQTDPQRAEELVRQLDLNPGRLAHWADVAGHLRVHQDQESGLYEQFEGFFDLEDLDLTTFEPRIESMQALLGIEGANKAQVLKQPDVLMFLFLLRDQYNLETLRANWDYYAPRTDHTFGSSLGPAIHAILACHLGMPAKAYEHFMRAALVDLHDLRGNTADGIHAASAGAAWQAVVFGFGGLRLTERGPVAAPCLPAHWTRLRFRVRHHDAEYEFDMQRDSDPGGAVFASSSRRAEVIPDVRGVIFDLDGVLADTSEFHYRAWKRLADEEGMDFDRQTNEALRGVSRRESLLRILDGQEVSEARLQELMARKNRYYAESIAGVTPENLLPGVLELLDELKARGVHVAVGSASKNTRPVVGRLGIEAHLDAISDGYSVERPKPAPDLFLHAAAQLNLDPAHCLVVEDASSGVEAALAARMWVVGLGPVERVGAAHVVLSGLAGVRWADLQAHLNRVAVGHAAIR
jgi:beta-phosphoglucomutase